MRIFNTILFVLLFINVDTQRLTVIDTFERFEDPFENSYYPIWYSSIGYSLKDESKYLELSAWGDVDLMSFIYVNITINFKSFWISFNPLRADIYNPKVQTGFTFLVFHPPR